GLSGTDTAEVGRRFETIGRALSEESVAISVGLAALEEGETRDDLIARADAALLVEKRKRRA
ncbi:MAG: sensor domain-containing diguanylate cyclase, partial [Chloroflexota bacterium]|nr:sensor domain-containing diguanylate cyclase [Chloroflexota bacterium]